MDTKLIKQNAKEGVKGNKLDFLIFSILSGIVNSGVIGLFTVLLFNNIKPLILMGAVNTGAIRDMPKTFYIYLVLLYLVIIVLAGASFMGVYINAGNMYDGYGINISDAFWFIKHPFKSFAMGWSLLWRMCIPIYGFIAPLKTAMVCQCYADNSKGSIHSKWKEASVAMKGFKLRYFGFNLSMIFWWILVMTGIGAIWAVPWIYTAQIGFCKSIKYR